MSNKEILKKINSKQVDLKQFGKNIRFLREAEGLTLEDVSGLLGYKTPSVVAKWEKGMTRPPVESVVKMGLMFGASTDFLLTESVEESEYRSMHTVPMDPEYAYDITGCRVKCCPGCGKPLDVNGNDGRFCKYCGQEISGKEDYGSNVISFKKKPRKKEKVKEFKWDWY